MSWDLFGSSAVFSTTVPLANGLLIMPSQTISSALTFTTVGPRLGSECRVALTADGVASHIPNFSAFTQHGGVPWNNTANVTNLVRFWFDGVNQYYSIEVAGQPSAPGASLAMSSQLGKWRNVLAKVRAGTGRGRIVLVGDSTTAGAGAGTSGQTNLVGAQPLNRTMNLAARLAALGIPTQTHSFMADQYTAKTSVTLPQYDPRISIGTNWQQLSSSNYTVLGGYMLRNNSTSGVLGFTPTAAIDNFTVYYIRNGGLGTATVNVDGGASLGTINANGAASIQSQSFSVTRGSHQIQIVGATAQFYLIGIVAWDSTQVAVDLITCGMWGATSADFINNANFWNPGSSGALAFLGQDLSILQFTINDSNLGIGQLPLYTANMSGVISGLKAQGDLIVESGIPSNTSQATDGVTLPAFVASLRSMATMNGCNFFDIGARLQSYAVANGLGWMYDSVHANAIGYQDIAQAEAILLASI